MSSSLVSSSIILSLADLSRSSVPLIWELCNENFGCFSKDYGSMFYRNLNSIQIPDPDFNQDFEPKAVGGQKFIRFSDYFERKTGVSYEMGSLSYQPEINKVFDDALGAGSAMRACSSIDQSSMQFFIAYFLEELSLRHENRALMLKKKDVVQIDYDESARFRLKVKFEIEQALDPQAPEAISIPFNVNLEADFLILNTGVQLKNVFLSGSEADFAKSLLLGIGKNYSLLDRIQLSCAGQDLEKADPLVALVMISPAAAIGLCDAIAMGADITPVKSLAQMTDLNMYKFLGVIGSFVSGGNLESLIDMGPLSLFERQKLKQRLPEIKEKFYEQLALMQSLCVSSTPILGVPSEGLFNHYRKSTLRVSHLSRFNRFNRRHSAPVGSDVLTCLTDDRISPEVSLIKNESIQIKGVAGSEASFEDKDVIIKSEKEAEKIAKDGKVRFFHRARSESPPGY